MGSADEFFSRKNGKTPLTKLEARMDWRPFMKKIQYVAEMLDVWEYVDPDGSKENAAPEKEDHKILEKEFAAIENEYPDIDRKKEPRKAMIQDQIIQFRIKALSEEKMSQQRAKRLEYERANKNIRWLALTIPDVVGQRWRQAIQYKTSPREILQILEKVITPIHFQDIRRASDRFDEVVTRKNIQDWSIWVDDFDQAYNDCIELKVTGVAEIAVKDFLEAIRVDHEYFWRLGVGRYQEEKEKGAEINNGNLIKHLIQFFRSCLALKEYNVQRLQGRAMDMQERDEEDRHRCSRSRHRSSDRGRSELPDHLQTGSNILQQRKGWGKCLGCRGVHPMRKEAQWWISCWNFQAIYGKGMAPPDWTPSESVKDQIKIRLENMKEEKKAALKWVEEKK